MTVESIIYICIYICVCIVIFDLFYIINVWYNDKILSRRTEYLRKSLETLLDTTRINRKRSEQLVKKLYSRMCNTNWLLAYFNAFNLLQKHNQESENIQLHKLNIRLFEKLSEFYTDHNEESKAFFAYTVYKIIPTMENINEDYRTFNNLVRNLGNFMNSRSIYVWCNVFRAIVKMGSVRYVYYALTLLNRNIHLRNSKFFSNYLTEFKGDLDLLNTQLLDSLLEFSPEMQ